MLNTCQDSWVTMGVNYDFSLEKKKERKWLIRRIILKRAGGQSSWTV